MAKKSNKLNKNIKGSKKVGEDGLFNWLNQPLKKPVKPITVGSTPQYDWGQNAEIGNEKLADQYIKSTAPGQFFTTVDTQAEVLPNSTILDKSTVSGTPFEKSDVVNNRKRSPFENIKRNEAITFGLAGVDAYLRKNQAIRDQYNYNKRLSNTLTQKPITDVNYWRGPGSNQGSQYQSLIMAKDGAQIRKTASPDFGDVEVEGGEFIQLPDLTTQHVQGPSHAKGGVHTSLPEGSRVFSDFLKPLGSKKTYAQLAKKYDTAQYKKILDNPYANQIDRNTAKKMFDRNESILNELFQDQQIQNGNSDGTDQAAEMTPEMMAKFGLDLKKGEKLSFTDPFQMGGEYYDYSNPQSSFMQDGGLSIGYEDPENLYRVYNPYNAYNNIDDQVFLEYGGQYVGGYAEFEDGGMFPADSTFYNNPVGDNYENNGFYDVMGSSTFQGGGLKGKRRVQYISSGYEDRPGYNYPTDKKGAAPEAMKERLKNALIAWELDSEENIKKIENATSVEELDRIAGMMQRKVAKDNPTIAEDFGVKVAPTRSGLKYLTDLGDAELLKILEDKKLVDAVKASKGGAYYLDPVTRDLVTEKIRKNLPEEKKKEYAVKNFQDEEFYYRYPRVEKVEFDDEKEYEDYKKNINVGDKYVADPKLGLYFEPVFTKKEEKKEEKAPEETYPGSEFKPVLPYEQTPSTMGRFPAYQALPETLGFLSGMNPYSYYTPDYTHYEVAPPTLNIDSELQSIDDTVAALSAQTTGNPSVDNARRNAFFNQALQAKQQAFQRKQNYDAEARFKADLYNVGERTKENYMDVNAASTVYNEYMAAAQDAAERERLNAIQSLTDKTGKFYQDEYAKMLAVSALMPGFYYEGTDLKNPLKINPKAKEFYQSVWANKAKPGAKPETKKEMASTNKTASEVNLQNLAPIILPEIAGSNYAPMVDNLDKAGIKLPPGATVLRPSFMPRAVKKGMFPAIPSGYTDFGIPEIPSQDDFYLP